MSQKEFKTQEIYRLHFFYVLTPCQKASYLPSAFVCKYPNAYKKLSIDLEI